MIRIPGLTPFDRAILECLPAAEDIEQPGMRLASVALCVVRPGVPWHRSPTTMAELREVQEILNGLEAVGLAWNDNGWWRRG